MGPQRSATPFYTCTFPGCPSPVNVSIPLVASLQDLVRQTEGELQGVLQGTRTNVGTEVRSCRPVAAFSPEAMGRAAADREVVGYYRVRTAETMRLTEIEAAIADTSFANPGSVVLLVQRREGGAQGNFFFREAGALVNLSLLMFPLDAALLDRRQAAAPMLAAAEAPARPRRSWGPLLAGILIAAVSAGGAGWYFSRRSASADSAAVPVAASSLPLRAERQGDDLKVMWDLGSATIAHAISGVLDIDDGGTKRRIPLDEKQVRFGSVLYTPKSDEVSIDFTAVKEDGSAGQASVLVLLTRTANGAAGPEVKNFPGSGAAARAADRRILAPVRPFAEPAPKPVAAAPEEPETLPAAQLQNQSMGSVRLPAVSAPAPPPAPAPQVVNTPPQRVEPPAPAPPKQAAPAAPVVPYVGPELVSQVGARVPPELRGFLTRPITVAVRATIDETGRVIHAESVQQQKVIHIGFLSAATEAAARCVFRPARRGNTPVRGEAILTFHFNPR